MPLAELSVDLPEETWIHELSTAYPEVTIRVLTAMPDGESGFALLEITAPDPAAVVGKIAGHSQITAVEPLQRDDGRAVVQIETTAPLLLLSAQASGIPIEPPVVIREGVASVEVRASNERLSELGDQLERFGHSYTVEAVHERADPDRLLSERQRELLLAAVERGYYETPRDCSLTELAEVVGLAKSTCSEILRRAEGRVIERFVEENLAAPAESSIVAGPE